jgi:hypothetical protein
VPITDAEFERGEYVEDEAIDAIAATGDHEDERDLVIAFLGQNVGYAFTEGEIVRGVDYGDNETDGLLDVLIGAPAQAVDVIGDVAASAEVVSGIEGVLDDLVAEGIVERSEVTDGDETVAYYRISD